MNKVLSPSGLCDCIQQSLEQAKEIVNYRECKEIGGVIGSGRGKKTNDMIIAKRQKNGTYTEMNNVLEYKNPENAFPA